MKNAASSFLYAQRRPLAGRQGRIGSGYGLFQGPVRTRSRGRGAGRSFRRHAEDPGRDQEKNPPHQGRQTSALFPGFYAEIRSVSQMSSPDPANPADPPSLYCIPLVFPYLYLFAREKEEVKKVEVVVMDVRDGGNRVIPTLLGGPFRLHGQQLCRSLNWFSIC